MNQRSTRICSLLDPNGLEALIISSPTNIRYATGFTGSNGRVVVRPNSITLITDSRYTKWAADEITSHAPDVEIVIAPGRGEQVVAELLSDVAAIGLEAGHVTWSDADDFRRSFGAERVVATKGLVEGLREVKDADEIHLLREAASVGDAALQSLIDDLRPGPTEVDIARQLAQHMFDHAGVLPSFEIIVASGPNSAKPHHSPSERRLEVGDLVIIDSGATVGGYRSDMTRSFVLGAPNDQQRDILDIVKEAQQRGVDAVRSGIGSFRIDEACRTAIGEAGFGDFFTHGTGHGVGLDIHEAPSVSSSSTATLAPGHIITVEPGVYIPDVGGVRWEDTVVVTTHGADVLTRSPKQPLIEL